MPRQRKTRQTRKDRNKGGKRLEQKVLNWMNWPKVSKYQPRSHRCWRRLRRPSTESSRRASCCWRSSAGFLCCLSRKSAPLHRCSRRSSSPPARRHRHENSAEYNKEQTNTKILTWQQLYFSLKGLNYRKDSIIIFWFYSLYQRHILQYNKVQFSSCVLEDVGKKFLTIAEAFLVTLMGSPLLVMGISDLSMMYRQASRIPKLNWEKKQP